MTNTDSDLDDQIAQTRPPLMVRVSAGVLGVSGLVVLFFALQNFLGPSFRSEWLNYVKFFIIALALAQIFFAFKLGVGLRWAAIGGLAHGVFTLVVVGGWFGYMTYIGVFSLLGLMAVGSVFVAVACLPFSLEGAGRVSAARRRVRESGLELGF